MATATAAPFYRFVNPEVEPEEDYPIVRLSDNASTVSDEDKPIYATAGALLMEADATEYSKEDFAKLDAAREVVRRSIAERNAKRIGQTLVSLIEQS